MFIITTQFPETKNSSHFHAPSRTPRSSITHSGFADVHQHLDDHSHLFNEMLPNAQHPSEQKAALDQQPNAKVLFQFFDGSPMSQS